MYLVLARCMVWGLHIEAFAELFPISPSKEAKLVAQLYWSHGNFHWDISFISEVQDWELEILVFCLKCTLLYQDWEDW